MRKNVRRAVWTVSIWLNVILASWVLGNRVHRAWLRPEACERAFYGLDESCTGADLQCCVCCDKQLYDVQSESDDGGEQRSQVSGRESRDRGRWWGR